VCLQSASQKKKKKKENHYLNYRICSLYNRRRREPLLASSTICFNGRTKRRTRKKLQELQEAFCIPSRERETAAPCM